MRRLASRVVVAASLLVGWSGLTRAEGEPAGQVRPAMQVRPVMIVRPSGTATEILSRLRGELLSVGLSVDIAERPAQATSDGTSSRAWMERAAAERAIDAALDIIDGAAPAAVDIWIFSSTSGRSEVTRVSAESDSATALERLSIRCVEVLRSILAERTLGRVARREAPPPPALATTTAGPSAPDAEHRRRLGLELGAAVVTTVDVAASSISPLVRVDWAVSDVLALQLEGAALGSRAGFATADGSARLSQQFALAGVCACWPSSNRRLRPTFALSAGALHSAVTGQADAPAEGHGLSSWSLLIEASAGVRVALTHRYELSLAAHAQLAEPYVVVYVVDKAVATAGRPGLGLSLTLGGWL